MSFATGLLSDVPHDLQQYVASLGPEKIMAILNSATQYNQAVVTDNDSGKKTVKTSKKKGVMDATATKNIRPLNSWIAFRSFYRKIFGSFLMIAFPQKRFQQKEISGFLTILWQVDPFKAKWTILAKAYSVIRDTQGKSNAPLDAFLGLAGPLIGIVPLQDYLSVTGWQMTLDVKGEVKLIRDPKVDLKGLPRGLLTTNLSVQDIVKACLENGYVTGNTNADFAGFNQLTLAMASIANGSGSEQQVSASIYQSSPLTDWSIDELLAEGAVDEVAYGPFDGQFFIEVDSGCRRDFREVHDPVNPVFTTNPAFEPRIALGNEKFTLNEDFPFNNFYQGSNELGDFDPYMGNDFNTYNITDFSMTDFNNMEGGEFDFPFLQ